MAATRAEMSRNSAENSALAARLAREITGDVLFDPFNRGRYATDASFYQIMPAGVVDPPHHGRGAAGACDRPRRRAGRHAARRRHLAMRPDRQSRHRRRLFQAPEPHHVARRREPHLRGRARASCSTTSTGSLEARVVVSGRCLDRLARHHRRHGRQQFLRRPFAALRHHARQHAGDGRSAGRRQRCCISARCRAIRRS